MSVIKTEVLYNCLQCHKIIRINKTAKKWQVKFHRIPMLIKPVAISTILYRFDWNIAYQW